MPAECRQLIEFQNPLEPEQALRVSPSRDGPILLPIDDL